ncbi:MAG TPA: DUF748 domain-containing protein, partial [Pseudorhodoferax sp.]|nr:DUF748 domain-containing protein [Pseudorhodoferax sp.]
MLLGLAFVWSAGMLWVPPLVKSQTERVLGAALGRSVQVGSVEFRPWSLELTLRDLVVRTQDGAGEQLRVGSIYADAALASVWRLAPVLDALQVDRPQLMLRQIAPGHYDIDDILTRLSAPSDQPAGEPAAFALYNLALTGGAVDFQDDVVQHTHELRGLQLGVPFLSNLPADRAVETEPRLAFVLNGSAFDSAAQSTPFLDSRKTAARLGVREFDVAPYLAYWPKSLPVQLRAGVLQADLQLQFEQTPATSVVLSGQLGLGHLRLDDAAGAPLLEVERVALDIAELRPLQRVLRLAALEVDAPQLRLQRDAAGRLNLLPASPAEASPAAAPTPEPEGAPAPGWTLALDKATLSGGRIAWTDHLAAPGAPPAELSVEQLALTLKEVAYPFAQPLQLQGAAQIAGGGSRTAALAFEGTATDQAADLRATVEHAPLELAARYLSGVLKPRLQGELSGRLALAWKVDEGLVATAEQLAVTQLALATTTPTDIQRLELRDARVDLARQSVEVGLLRLERPRTSAVRDAKGRWMYEDWLVAGAPAAPSAPAAAPAVPWHVTLRGVELDEGALSYADQSMA